MTETQARNLLATQEWLAFTENISIALEAASNVEDLETIRIHLEQGIYQGLMARTAELDSLVEKLVAAEFLLQIEQLKFDDLVKVYKKAFGLREFATENSIELATVELSKTISEVKLEPDGN